MPETFSGKLTGTIGADSFTQSIESTGDSLERATPTVPGAKTGTLTTRTDNDTGVATMTAGHGFATNDKIDLFWATGSRRNMTATVSVNAVTLDGGSGDNLPTANTPVTAMKPHVVDFVVEGDDLVGLGVSSPQRGWIVVVDDAAAETKVWRFDAAGGFPWGTGIGFANPLAGATTATVKFSHASTTDQVMKIAAVF